MPQLHATLATVDDAFGCCFSDARRTVRCLDLPRIWLLSPTNLAFGFGHSDHKMIATNDKRTIKHLWSFETFVVLMDVASCGTETLGAAYMNGYFNAEIALKIGGPGQAVTISYDLLFYRVSSLKSQCCSWIRSGWILKWSANLLDLSSRVSCFSGLCMLLTFVHKELNELLVISWYSSSSSLWNSWFIIKYTYNDSYDLICRSF